MALFDGYVPLPVCCKQLWLDDGNVILEVRTFDFRVSRISSSTLNSQKTSRISSRKGRRGYRAPAVDLIRISVGAPTLSHVNSTSAAPAFAEGKDPLCLVSSRHPIALSMREHEDARKHTASSDIAGPCFRIVSKNKTLRHDFFTQ